MMVNEQEGSAKKGSVFSEQAKEARPSVIRELLAFLRDNKRWWLTPIVFILLLVGTLIVLSSSVAAPFIYTLF